MSPAEARAFLDALAPAGVRLGLERIHEALAALANPEAAYPAIHVAGTNGKGSTCAFAASCLETQGYRVGFYSSPHLERVNERFRVNGEEISDELLGERIAEVLEHFSAPPPLTYFEMGTLVAFWHFARERVDVAVLETGLGGRLDATNCGRPKVTCITPISFDHMEYLGNTLAEIAGEKAGILKPGVPAVVARQPPEALAVIEARAREVGAPLRLEGRDFEPGKFELGLRGPHQLQNAACAVACVEPFGVSPENLRVGLAKTRWPGRLEELGGVLLDGAHNVAGVEALLAALDPKQEVHLVFGVLADKEYGPMIARLFPRCASVDLTPVPSARSLAPERYLAEARAACAHVAVHPSPEAALAAARRRGGLTLCAGSLYLIGAVRGLLRH